MEYRKITAIIHADSLEAVEEAIKHAHAGAFEVAITRVKGYGDYKNFYSTEWISEQARVEAFVPRAQAASVVEAICRAAYTGLDSDGMIAVLPVENIVRIKDWMPKPKP
jgi:nitrogen regulatory protein P-II 1